MPPLPSLPLGCSCCTDMASGSPTFQLLNWRLCHCQCSLSVPQLPHDHGMTMALPRCPEDSAGVAKASIESHVTSSVLVPPASSLIPGLLGFSLISLVLPSLTGTCWLGPCQLGHGMARRGLRQPPCLPCPGKAVLGRLLCTYSSSPLCTSQLPHLPQRAGGRTWAPPAAAALGGSLTSSGQVLPCTPAAAGAPLTHSPEAEAGWHPKPGSCKGLRGARPGGAEQPGWYRAKSCREGAAF